MIYLAGPIHQKEDWLQNKYLIELLREWGFDVWSPQEAGIACDIAKETGRELKDVRKEFCKKDLEGMKQCAVCLAYLGREREPSQGMLWEMGWFAALERPVIFYNPCDNPITLMAEFTSKIVKTEEELLECLRDWSSYSWLESSIC